MTIHHNNDFAINSGPPPSERDTILNQPLQLEFIKLDADSFKSVQQFAQQFKALEYPLHLLVCSEAIINVPQGLSYCDLFV